MSFRARLTLVAAAAVALAIVVASAVVFVVVRGQLRGESDDSLRARADALRIGVTDLPGSCFLVVPPERFGGPTGEVQLVLPDGTACLPENESVSLPISSKDRSIASGRSTDTYFRDATVAGQHVRIMTQPAVGPLGRLYGALQVVRSLEEVDRALDRIKLFLILIAGGGIAVAVALGLAVSRAALAPVRRLTGATERVTETGDLSERIEAGGRDELSRLAGSFNTMLGALEESTRAQRQLVADASHELRTPLTSLRTNIEVLASERKLPVGERQRLITDVVDQLGEMTTLISEVIELARGEQQTAEPEEIRLDLLAADAVDRARRDLPNVVFSTDLQESVVHGVPVTIERAVTNLLDNAAKWSPPGGEIEVAVRDGVVTVRDHGSGIDEEDLPYVFDRFYRAPSARGMPGSGLGLAIVRQVATAHGGEVVAEQADGGGTRMTFRLGQNSGLSS